jgi:hypothetical protein
MVNTIADTLHQSTGPAVWTRELWKLALERGLSFASDRQISRLPARPSRRYGYRRQEIEAAWGGWALGLASGGPVAPYSDAGPRLLARGHDTLELAGRRMRVRLDADTDRLAGIALMRIATTTGAQVDFSLLTRGMWRHALARQDYIRGSISVALTVVPQGRLVSWALHQGLSQDCGPCG